MEDIKTIEKLFPKTGIEINKDRKDYMKLIMEQFSHETQRKSKFHIRGGMCGDDMLMTAIISMGHHVAMRKKTMKVHKDSPAWIIEAIEEFGNATGWWVVCDIKKWGCVSCKQNTTDSRRRASAKVIFNKNASRKMFIQQQTVYIACCWKVGEVFTVPKDIIKIIVSMIREIQ